MSLPFGNSELSALDGAVEVQRKYRVDDWLGIEQEVIKLGGTRLFSELEELDEIFKGVSRSSFVKLRSRPAIGEFILIAQAFATYDLVPLLINEPERAKQFLGLAGFISVGTITKTRTMYVLGQCNVKLDTLATHGSFVEIGTFVENANGTQLAEDTVAAVAKALSIGPDQQVGSRYFQMFGLG